MHIREKHKDKLEQKKLSLRKEIFKIYDQFNSVIQCSVQASMKKMINLMDTKLTTIDRDYAAYMKMGEENDIAGILIHYT